MLVQGVLWKFLPKCPRPYNGPSCVLIVFREAFSSIYLDNASRNMYSLLQSPKSLYRHRSSKHANETQRRLSLIPKTPTRFLRGNVADNKSQNNAENRINSKGRVISRDRRPAPAINHRWPASERSPVGVSPRGFRRLRVPERAEKERAKKPRTKGVADGLFTTLFPRNPARSPRGGNLVAWPCWSPAGPM